METSKDVCTYYTPCEGEDKYDNTIIETSLREIMRNFKLMLEIWESVETIFLSTAPPSATPIFLVKASSTHGVLQRIITDNYHWVRINVRKCPKKCPSGHIRRQPYHKMGLYVF